MQKKIYIGRIAQATTDQKLFDHFSKIGKVVSATITKGIGAEKHAGHGYVVMENEKDIETAIHKLNNSILDGNRILVIQAHYLDQERKQHYYRRY